MKKRIVGILLALVLVSVAVTSFATTITNDSVPSKTTQDMVTAVSGVTASGKTVTISTADAASIQAAERFLRSASFDLSITIRGNLLDSNPYTDLIKALDPSYTVGVPDVKPVINELIPVKFEGYAAGDGDVTASFEFATPYEDGAKIAALVGISTDTYNVDYYVLTAEVVNGVVNVHFTADVLEKMANFPSFLAIVNAASIANAI